MHRQSARLVLLVTAAALFVAGPSLSQPRVGREPQPRTGPDGRVASGPRVASIPDPRSAAAASATAAVPATPASPAAPAEPATPATPSIPAAPSTPRSEPEGACPAGGDMTYTVPESMAPVTNRSTCRHQGRNCCQETRDWCLSEGFLWLSCENCYCGSQCMGPSLFD